MAKSNAVSKAIPIEIDMFGSSNYSTIQRILDNSPNIIFTKGKDRRYTLVNRAMCEMFDAEPLEILGKRDEDFELPEKDLARFEEEDRIVLDRGEDFFSQPRPFKFKNDIVRWYKTVKSPLRDDNNEIYGLISVVTDVSDQINYKKSIEKSQKILDLIYNNVTDFIALLEPVDGEYRYVSCNKAYFDIFRSFGVEIEETDIIGIDFISHALKNGFFTPKAAEEARERIEKVLASKKTLQFTEVTKTPTGTLYVDSSLTPFMGEDGEIIYFMYRATNFTDIMRTNQALQEREMLLESINRNVNDGIYRSTVREGMRYANDAMYRLFGYSPEEFRALAPSDLYVNEGERDRIIATLRKQGSFANRELELRKKNGKTFWARISATLTREPDGSEIIDGIIVDITKTREIQSKLEASNQNLVKTNSELNHLVYRTSHDLRSPIASLLGLSELLKLEGLKESQEEYIDLMEDQLHKLDKIILDIINYRKIAKAGLQIQEIKFETIVRDILSGIRFLENYQNIHQDLEIYCSAPFYNDGHNIQIILNNLISNAIKYSRRDIENPWIKLRIIGDEEKVEIEMADNGIGIEENHLDHIYEMFYRATTQNTGTGLGLFIVKEAVDKLGGSIEISSKPMEGTSFKLLLPNRGEMTAVN